MTTARQHGLRELDRTGRVNLHHAVLAICLTAVWRRFRGEDTGEVAACVTRLHAFSAQCPGRFWPLEAEMLIHDALGERVGLDHRRPDRSP